MNSKRAAAPKTVFVNVRRETTMRHKKFNISKSWVLKKLKVFVLCFIFLFIYHIHGQDILVKGNGTVILNGDTIPNMLGGDQTYFGKTNYFCCGLTKDYDIFNTGTDTLRITSSVTFTQSGADFSVSSQPTKIAPGKSGLLRILFNPVSPGIKKALVYIPNNSSSKNPYYFAILGEALEPEIKLVGNGIEIFNKDSVPSTGDNTDFGSSAIGVSVSKTFTIENIGATFLNLTNLPNLVQITGANASDFTLTTKPSNSISYLPGFVNTTTFTITFNPSAPGLRKAQLRIASTDLDENPFVFNIQGTGSAASVLTLTSGTNPSVLGGNVVYSATLSWNSILLHTQLVALKSGSTTIATALTNTFGIAEFNISSLAIGKHKLTAEFAGTTSYSAAKSDSLTQIVNPTGSPFVTRWNMATTGSATNQLNLNIETGGTIHYTWTDVNTGAVTFGTASGTTLNITGLPNNNIDLKIYPTNFNRFVMDFGPDRNRLIDVKNWGSVAWTSMLRAFHGCRNLNVTATDIPNLSNATSLSYMFNSCYRMTGPSNINSWNVGTITNMSFMFALDSLFNQPLNAWNVSNVTNMSAMFHTATAFNQPLNRWNVGNVSNMSSMFSYTKSFNQRIDSWNTQSVTDMSAMFFVAEAFNRPIGNWNVSNVLNMRLMFSGAIVFNQDLSNWSIQSVTDLGGIFSSASAFNQSLAAWGSKLNSNVSLSVSLNLCGMDCNNYAATLMAWNANGPNGRTLGAVKLFYNKTAAAARANLVLPISSGGKGWTISDAGDLSKNIELVPNYKTVSTNTECDELVNSNKKVIVKIMDNGNSFSYNSTAVTITTSFVNSIPSGVDTVRNGGGYYQKHNGTDILRISKRMITIQNPGTYNTNGGVIVRIYYAANDVFNISRDSSPAGINAITEKGWFKSSVHSAQGVVNNLSIVNGILFPSASAITPLATGTESGIRYVEFLVNGFSTFGYYSLSHAVPLSVSTATLSANRINNSKVKLNWNIENVPENSTLEIQRRLENEKEFKSIFTIQNNKDGIDKNDFLRNSFYRIKITHIHGDVDYSKPVMVANELYFATQIYPNPTQGKITVATNNELGINKIFIFDAKGKTIFESKGIDDNKITINTDFGDGIYYLRIIFNDGNIELKKFTKFK